MGLPATQAISRRYQYGFPLIIFLYRLATALGHRPLQDPTPGDTPRNASSARSRRALHELKIELSGKLGLGDYRSRVPAEEGLVRASLIHVPLTL